MTKEQIKQKAEEYADKHAFRVPYDGSNKFYDDVDFNASKEGYLAGAEPREKHIAELTEQNTSLLTSVENLNKSVQEHETENKNLLEGSKDKDRQLNNWYSEWKKQEKQIQIDAEQIRALQKQNGELTDENERLKGDLELWESGACRATNLDKCGVVKELKAQIEKMKCCKNCANYMISGKCPSFFRTGWCKNWEMTRSKK